MKGFKDSDGKFHPINNNHVLKNKSNSKEGIKITRKMKAKEPDINDVIEKTEKEWEKDLKNYDFDNPKLKNKNWEVSITYEGGYSEEYFRIWASPKGVEKAVEFTTFISNFDWSEGLDEDLQKEIESNEMTASREYDKWLVDSFEEIGKEAFFDQLIGDIEDEFGDK